MGGRETSSRLAFFPPRFIAALHIYYISKIYHDSRLFHMSAPRLSDASAEQVSYRDGQLLSLSLFQTDARLNRLPLLPLSGRGVQIINSLHRRVREATSRVALCAYARPD